VSVVIVEPAVEGWRVVANGVPVPQLFETKAAAKREGKRLAERYSATLRVRTESGSTRETNQFRLFDRQR